MNNYVVTVHNQRGQEYVSFGHGINLSKRAATQLKNGLSKIDSRYKRTARVIMAKTARKYGLMA